MRISSAFPSKYLKASDLQGHIVPVQIREVKVQDVGTADMPDEKPVLYFSGKEKGLVLNKTNAGTISGMYGDDTDNWTGKRISLFEDETDFQGRRVACIRVRLKPPAAANGEQNPAAAPAAKSAPPVPAPVHSGPIPDDEIPFAPDFSPCMV